jgi:hypothetical protein
MDDSSTQTSGRANNSVCNNSIPECGNESSNNTVTRQPQTQKFNNKKANQNSKNNAAKKPQNKRSKQKHNNNNNHQHQVENNANRTEPSNNALVCTGLHIFRRSLSGC